VSSLLQVTPKFCKLYARIGEVVQEALSQYIDEVSTGAFPSTAYSPYRLEKNQLEPFVKELENRGFHAAAEAAHGAGAKDLEADRLKTKISTG
jgi:3-methyl-2-oxobutanoate hydroxymethyltransferase